MGQQQSVIKIEEAESKVSGQHCYTTGPLDELCDYDRLWQELRAGLRTDFTKDPSLKSGEVTEISNDEFRLSKVHDGEKLKLPVPELRYNLRYVLDQENGVVLEEVRDLVMDVIQDLRIIRTLRDPLRIEISSQRLKYEERRAGPLVVEWIKRLLTPIIKRDVAVEGLQPSKILKVEGVRSAISEPLDNDVGSAEELYKALLQCSKTQEHNLFAKDVSVSEVTRDGKKDCFTVWWTFDGEKMKEAGLPLNDGKLYYRVEAGEEALAFCTYIHEAKTRRILDSYFTVVHKEPLCVEAWAQWPVAHEADPDLMRRIVAAGFLNEMCFALLQRLDKL